ncbi:MAG: hypothetical protein JXB03_01370 [Spirochaetales bacterium]|nr:hypothetical protein [Spirochaetales bacterium]
MMELLCALMVSLSIVVLVFLSDVRKRQREIFKRLHALEGRGADMSAEAPLSSPGGDSVEKETVPVSFDPPGSLPQAPEKRSSRIRRFIASDAFRGMSNRFMENWIAVAGVMVLVAGLSFFGIWASTRVSPGLRFGLIVAAAAGLFGASWALARRPGYTTLAQWLKSASGAVYLFASLGAGGIPGLQWIYNPLFALGFLLTGIAVNLLLSFWARNEYLSGLHVLLGLIALAVAPQNAVTLFVAAVITFSGISLTLRKKADVHHLITLCAFFLFLFYWGWKADTSVPFYNMSALGVLFATAALTLLLHYRRVYTGRDFDPLPFSLHLLNWLFLALGTVRFAPGFRFTSVPLFVCSLLLFLLARHAKNLKIPWLFLTDTMMAQLMTVVAVMFLFRFDVSVQIIFFIVLVQTIIFHVVVSKEGSLWLPVFGAFLVAVAAAVLGLYLLGASLPSGGYDRPAAVFILYAASGLVGLFLLSTLSTLRTFHSVQAAEGRTLEWGIRGYSAAASIAGFSAFLLVTALFATAERYRLLPGWLSPETLCVVPFVFFAWVRYRLINRRHTPDTGVSSAGMTAGLYGYLLVVWLFVLVSALFDTPDSSYFYLGYFLPPWINAAALVPLSGFHRKKRLFSADRPPLNPGVLSLSVLFAVWGFTAFHEEAPLAVSLVWMLLSAGAAAAGSLSLSFPLPAKAFFPGHEQGVKKTLVLSGLFLVPLFVLRVMFMDSASQVLVAGIMPARYAVEVLAAGVLAFWFFRISGRVELLSAVFRKVTGGFLELLSAFIVLIIMMESHEKALPAALGVYGILLALAGGRSGPVSGGPRLLLHSVAVQWVACIALIAASRSVFGYSEYGTGEPWIPGLMAMAVLFFQVYLLHRRSRPEILGADEGRSVTSRLSRFLLSRKNLLLLYPVFISLIFFFAWSFRPVFLTVFLCAEVFVIFVLGILLKENHFRYVSMAGLLACLVRLVAVDLVHLHTLEKALVCMAVAVVMLGMNLLYNRFSSRFDNPS